MRNDLIDSYDIDVSIDFVEFTQIHGYECLQPQYMLNTLSFISRIIRETKTDKRDILKIYDLNIWLIIFVMFIFCSFLNTLITKSSSKREKFSLSFEKFSNSLLIYFKPFLNTGSGHKPFNLIYLLWIVSIYPLVEIFKNELLAELVSEQDFRINTLNDVIKSGNSAYFHWTNIEILRQISNDSNNRDNELSIFANLMKDRANSFDQMFELPATLTAEEFNQKLKFFTIFASEESIAIIYEVLNRFFDEHIASSAYLPNMVTTLCFRPNFEHKILAQNSGTKLVSI